MLKKVIIIFSMVISMFCNHIQAQDTSSNNFMELIGVVMSADSLRYLPYCTIEVLNKDNGTIASDKGVFSLLVERGDTLLFNFIGYRDKKYIVPQTMNEKRYSMVQLMVQDTFYLPETFIRPGPSRERFDWAFKNWNIPDDKYEVARRNTEVNTLRMLAVSLPKDGRENQAVYQKLASIQNSWVGQRPPQNIFSPFAWIDFINAWKRGDFRKKKRKQ
jgi:hypothetical protein